jgi:phage-related protein
MSAIAPRNSSPAIVVEKKDALPTQSRGMQNQMMPFMGGGQMMPYTPSTKDVILEILVLAAAAIAIIIVAYVVFKPLFSGIFGTALDTINTLTDITAETLGTVTEVLGGVIEDAAAAISTVTGTISTTINTLSGTITGVLDNIAGPAVEGVSEGGTLTVLSNEVTKVIKNLTEIIISDELVNGKPKGIIPKLAAIIDDIIETTTEVLTGDNGIMTSINDFITMFKNVIETASEEFQNIIKSLKAGADTIINGIQDGIRYLVDPFVNETYGIPAIGNKMLLTIETLTNGISAVGNGIKEAIDSISEAIQGLI